MRSFYRMVRTAMHALRRHLMRSMLTCLGIVFGFDPAWRASRLDPIEAMRHE